MCGYTSGSDGKKYAHSCDFPHPSNPESCSDLSSRFSLGLPSFYTEVISYRFLFSFPLLFCRPCSKFLFISVEFNCNLAIYGTLANLWCKLVHVHLVRPQIGCGCSGRVSVILSFLSCATLSLAWKSASDK